jgi:hypothetical protein
VFDSNYDIFRAGQTIVDSGPRPGKLDYLTEYSANHNDQHSTRCSTASTSSPMAISVEELKLKNKEGTSTADQYFPFIIFSYHVAIIFVT